MVFSVVRSELDPDQFFFSKVGTLLCSMTIYFGQNRLGEIFQMGFANAQSL